MSLSNIVANDYGQIIQLTVLDTDTSTAGDISGYGVTKQMIFKDPSGNQAVKTASFVTDGTDGLVKYTLASGDIDESGIWAVRVKLTGAGKVLTSTWLEFAVL